jgi:hypothetical protein
LKTDLVVRSVRRSPHDVVGEPELRFIGRVPGRQEMEGGDQQQQPQEEERAARRRKTARLPSRFRIAVWRSNPH